MRFKKNYLGDITSTIIPKNFNRYTRLAQITSVDGDKGTCSIRFLDIPSTRTDVILIQPSEGVFNIPKIGSIILVTFDQYARPWIQGYINLGHENRVKTLKTLPKLKPGEKFFEAGGSYFYIRNNGNIIISTLSGNIIEIENTSGSLKFETVNWKVITEGGLFYFGLVKRLIKESDENYVYKPVLDLIGNSYTELNLKITETADGTLGIDQNVTPLIDLTLGTVINDKGDKLTKNDTNATTANKEILLRLKLKNGTQIDIDKEGRCTLKGIKININNASVDYNDPDIILNLEKNISSYGTKGQHVAREHDEINIPISTVHSDEEHLGLSSKNNENLLVLQKLVPAIITPTGACIAINTAILGQNTLKGEIVEGAKNVYIGDY